MYCIERPPVIYKDLPFGVAEVVAHVIFDKRLQVGVDGRADIEASCEQQVYS